MRFRINDPEKIAKAVTIVTLFVVVAWGLVSVVAEVRPFWVDEWRIIYNLKFKTPEEIWGKLAFMQQFPRVYLFVLKLFAATFNYSYFSLRLPSYLIGLSTIAAIYKLSNKLYSTANNSRLLMVMMLVSCGTFTEYFVQVKQYTMDLFLCVIAIHQLLYLSGYGSGKKVNVAGYSLLCLSFLVAPFFSYTYSIAIAPVYTVILVQNILQWGADDNTRKKIKTILLQWVPLFICTFSITVFYSIDIAQLSRDKDMHVYWGHLMMQDGFDIRIFFTNIFHLFAQVGSGFIFWWLFGLLGVAGFGYGIYRCSKTLFSGNHDTKTLVLLYSILLPLLAIALFAAGKLPIGEPRLNAFIIPAISIVVIHLLDAAMARQDNWAKATRVLSFVLLAGVIGNIYSTILASFTDEKYARRMEIYHATEKAVTTAREQQLPILITPEVAYPYDKTINLPFSNTVPGDWVLMTFPAYHVGESQPVYAIDDVHQLQEYLGQLPASTTSVMVGDGIHYRIVQAH